MAEYFYLDSLFRNWRNIDPNGTYILETKMTHWMFEGGHLEQFHHAYVAMSSCKQSWVAGGHTGIMFCDGTSTKSPHFKHILLFAVMIDK
jgi:hypothetical protein